MGRTEIKPIRQPDDYTCGPTALKHALSILGIRKSIKNLVSLCMTNNNGTSTKHMINAILRCRLAAMLVERATLKNIRSVLRYTSKHIRAILVCYLYDTDIHGFPMTESGHWATVSSFSSARGKIILFDSYTGSRKSYPWPDFRNRWIAYDLKRRLVSKFENKFTIIRKWQPQQIIVIARDSRDFPKFSSRRAKIFPPYNWVL